MKLGIISHTAHFKNRDGQIFGFGPTVREINFLSAKFDKIIHAGVIHEGNPGPGSIAYESDNIQFIGLPASGGKSINDKISSLKHISEIIKSIQPLIYEADIIQLRVPTGMANYLFPYFNFIKRSARIWVKYAGNWEQKNPPAGYRFQRWWLKNNFLNCKVTINGKWPGQPAHCISFENPCLSHEERIEGKNAINRKNYSGPLTACFIGRMEKEKGVERILDATDILKSKNIQFVHFIGDGPERKYYEKRATSTDTVKYIFHGNLNRTAIPVILEQAQLILLPSTASEGFPKVIAEGANYGAIPVVSNVSSIGQYINHENGYVWDQKTLFPNWLEQIKFNPDELIDKSISAYRFAEEFTFDAYYSKLCKHIINDC